MNPPFYSSSDMFDCEGPPPGLPTMAMAMGPPSLEFPNLPVNEPRQAEIIFSMDQTVYPPFSQLVSCFRSFSARGFLPPLPPPLALLRATLGSLRISSQIPTEDEISFTTKFLNHYIEIKLSQSNNNRSMISRPRDFPSSSSSSLSSIFSEASFFLLFQEFSSSLAASAFLRKFIETMKFLHENQSKQPESPVAKERQRILENVVKASRRMVDENLQRRHGGNIDFLADQEKMQLDEENGEDDEENESMAPGKIFMESENLLTFLRLGDWAVDERENPMEEKILNIQQFLDIDKNNMMEDETNHQASNGASSDCSLPFYSFSLSPSLPVLATLRASRILANLLEKKHQKTKEKQPKYAF